MPHVDETRALRIGFRLGHFLKLTETFIVSQIEGMISRGHRVSILADSPGEARSPLPPPAWISDLEAASQVLPNHPLLVRAHERLPYRARRALAAIEERRFCARNDVVVCNFGWFGAALARSVKGRSRRARIVTILHGDDMSRSVKQGGTGMYDELFEETDLLLPVSEFWRQRLLEMGAPEEKLVVHRMGVDVETFTFSVKPSFQRTFQFVTVGRLVEKKGTEFALRALARLRHAMPEYSFSFKVIGDGPLRSRLKALSAELGLDDSVSFLGALPHAEVAALLASSDVFVLPSVTAADGDMEGIPVSLIEAMASGLPVVSTRHSGIPELVEHGVSGLLAAERDERDLSLQLARFVSRPDDRVAFAVAARRNVERQFNNRLLNSRLDEILRQLVNEGGTLQPPADEDRRTVSPPRSGSRGTPQP